MIITSKRTMDLQNPGYTPVIHAVQDDRYTRNIQLTLLSGGEAWMIPETATVLIRFCKFDGKGGEYNTLPDGSSAWEAAENLLTVALAPQVLTQPGPVRMMILLLEGEKQLGTFGILLDVQPGVEAVADSEEYYNVTGFLPAPAKAKVGQYVRVASVDERGRITGMEAVDPGEAGSSMTADELLMADTYTLVREDYLYGVWDGNLDAGADTPYFTEVGDKFSTRKFRMHKVPRISYYYFTTPMEYLFWNNGSYVGKKTFAELSADWNVDFAFDQVAIIFSWGWEAIDTDVMVRTSIAGAFFEKVLVMGDSISADYYGNYPKWVSMLINERFFPAGTLNNSVHATGFVARYSQNAGEEDDFITRIQAVENKDSFDLVVIFGGINDYIQGIPMGTAEEAYTEAFIPAVDYFFDYVVNQFPQARIVVLSPLRTYNIYPNTSGHYQTEYTDYIRQAAKKYCLPVLNLTEESGFYPFVDTFKNMWTLVPEGYAEADGVHPNESYQKKFLAPRIRNFLEQLL